MKSQIVIERHVEPKAEAARNAYDQVAETKSKIRGLQKEVREAMLKNDDYRTVKLNALDANRELTFEKNKLLRMPDFKKKLETIDSLKNTLKTKQLTLFVELDKYTSETGQYILPLDEERKVIEREYKLKKF